MNRPTLHRKLSFKFSAGFILLALLVSAATCTIGFVKYTGTIQRLYNESAYTVAQVAASYIDGDRIAGYLDTQTPDAAYEEMAARLDTLRESSGAAYLFVYVPQGELIHYIYDAKNGSMPQMPLGSTDPISVKYRDLVVRVYDTGERSDSYFISHSRYGYNTSAILPVTDSAGNVTALVNVDVQMRIIQSALTDYLLTAVGIGTLLVFLFVFLYLTYLRRKVIFPIQTITKHTANFVENEAGFSAEALNVHTGDEIETLADALGKMEVDLGNYIRDLTAVTAEKERIGAELGVATHIQASMLPCIFPAFPGRPEFDIYATMTPAKEVGGDFYDFFLVDDDHLAMVMADVSGKGVPAALFMVIAKTLIKNIAQTGLGPKEVLEKANEQLCENNEAEMFVTVWLGILEISTGRLTAANAGHEYPAVRRAGGEYELIHDKHGFVLAGMEGARYREYQLDLGPGDRLYLYTDGVAEATDAADELFGTDRMLAALNRHRDAPCAGLLRAMQEEIDAFVGTAPQFDDITMLSLQLRAPEEGKA